MIEEDRKAKQLKKIIDSAIKVFSAQGYKEAQMSSIAKESGIALGTLYLYFKSKESLFNFLLKYIFFNETDICAMSVPISSPSWDWGITSGRNAFVYSKFCALFAQPLKGDPIADVHEEFEGIIRNLCSIFNTYRHGIIMLLRSSLNCPELADFYVNIVEELMQLLVGYLEKRMAQGLLRKVSDVCASARFILASIGWYAVHRHWTVHEVGFDEKVWEDTIVDALTHAFVAAPLQNPDGTKG
ncbi:MAG: TetR/AcrR family transcriptional regulator [Syntrophobacteraceae bacterium]